MHAEVIAVGSELLLGQIVDTNSATIARHFATIGLDLFWKTTVGDNLSRLNGALRQALGRSDVIVTTGGIGPTADDVTREAVAAATGRELVFSEALWGQIEAYFASRGLRPSPSNRRQAYVPSGATPIENPVGTAPGFIVDHDGKVVVTLPGVPREMEYLLVHRAVPFLRERFGLGGEIRLRVLKTVGLGESRIGELLGDFMRLGVNPTVGTLAHLGQVDVRVAAKAADPAAAARLIAPVEAEVRARLGEAVFGADDDTLEAVIGRALEAAGARLAIVEVGNAGLAGHRLGAAVAERMAGAIALERLEDARRVGLGPSGGVAPETAACELAAAAGKWAGAEVGAAAVLEGVADGAPGAVRVVVAVSAAGRERAREFRLGGEPAAIRARAATLLLDFVRRALAAGSAT